MTTFELVKSLCECRGVPSRENGVMGAIREALAGIPCETDALGNLVATVREAKEGEKTVLLEAHADRIGALVSYIGEEGFIRVQRAGGLDPHTLMGSELEIETKDGGRVIGCVGAPFPYPAKPHNTVPASEHEMPEIDAMYVDTGLADPAAVLAQGAEAIQKGAVHQLLGTRMAAPCLDDRACCAAIILAALQLKDEELGCGLKLLFSTREEIGGMGAATGTFSVLPDIAVAVDVTSAVSPDVKEEDGAKMGKGPQVDIAGLLDYATTEQLIETAKKNDIPYQLFVNARRTGTDADEMTIVASGVKTGLVSLPLRFMHHPVEVIDTEDLDLTAKLLACFVREVK